MLIFKTTGPNILLTGSLSQDQVISFSCMIVLYTLVSLL